MSPYILDTDHLTLWQQNHPFVVQHVDAINPRDIAVTIVTAEEQMYNSTTEEEQELRSQILNELFDQV